MREKETMSGCTMLLQFKTTRNVLALETPITMRLYGKNFVYLVGLN